MSPKTQRLDWPPAQVTRPPPVTWRRRHGGRVAGDLDARHLAAERMALVRDAELQILVAPIDSAAERDRELRVADPLARVDVVAGVVGRALRAAQVLGEAEAAGREQKPRRQADPEVVAEPDRQRRHQRQVAQIHAQHLVAGRLVARRRGRKMDLFEVGHVRREGEREPIAAVPQRHVGARAGGPLKRLPEVGGGRRAGRRWRSARHADRRPARRSGHHQLEPAHQAERRRIPVNGPQIARRRSAERHSGHERIVDRRGGGAGRDEDQRRGGQQGERPRVPTPPALTETHEVTRRYPKVPSAAMPGNALTVPTGRSYIRSMARTPTRQGRGSLPRSRQSLWALAVLVLGCSSRASSENIALWKTTEKGPERLHDALADHSVAPKLRAEAAVALVDLGRSNEVDTILSGASADDRAEITKTLEPAYEVAMKDPAPEKALAYRDALFSLRLVAVPEDQKRIDAALLPVLAGADRGGQGAAGGALAREDADRHRSRLVVDVDPGARRPRSALRAGRRAPGQGGRRDGAQPRRRWAGRPARRRSRSRTRTTRISSTRRSGRWAVRSP